MTNPLLEEWADAMGLRGPLGQIRLDHFRGLSPLNQLMFGPPGRTVDIFRAREELTRKYAWAVPTPEALRTVAKYAGPGLLSIGAGTGYWESLLAQLGVDVLAFDRRPPTEKPFADGGNSHGHTGQFFRVRPGTHRKVRRWPERTPFLSWPSYGESWACQAARWTWAEHFVYVGEGEGGCTADDAFFVYMERAWELIEEVWIPQWPGIHDRLFVWRRRPARGLLPVKRKNRAIAGPES